MRNELYNGWRNYPTWVVNMWLSNEEPLYREALERVRATVEDTSRLGTGPYVSEVFNQRERERFSVADMLKDWVTDELAPDLGATFVSDLLGYALAEVDWNEIADAWTKDVLAMSA